MAGTLLSAAELTESGRPVLYPNEIECTLLSSVDLEPESDYERDLLLKSSVLILTTHRLIFIQSHPSTSAVFLPLSSVTHIFTTKKKSIKQMFSHHPKVKFSIGQPRALNLTLVLRGKGDFDLFLSKFWESWRGRAWEHDQKSESSSSSGRVDGIGSSSSTTSRSGLMMAGVSGILRKEQETWENTDKTLKDAFQDLDALMEKAKDMVALAEKMRQKLLSGPSTQANASNDEELGSKQEIQDWMLSVGIVSPVTKESAGALYHQQLSRQLADFVKIPLDRAGGMINLIDVYCLFNRARGTELISPEDLLRACSIWESFDVPVMLRKFDSGVMVIQNKSHSDEEVFAKIKSIVLKSDALRSGISASDAAMTLGIAPAMAKEHLLNAETKGLLCRDISPDGFRFYINLFYEINLADIHLVKDHGVYASWVTAVSASR